MDVNAVRIAAATYNASVVNRYEGGFEFAFRFPALRAQIVSAATRPTLLRCTPAESASVRRRVFRLLSRLRFRKELFRRPTQPSLLRRECPFRIRKQNRLRIPCLFSKKRRKPRRFAHAHEQNALALRIERTHVSDLFYAQTRADFVTASRLVHPFGL